MTLPVLGPGACDADAAVTLPVLGAKDCDVTDTLAVLSPEACDATVTLPVLGEASTPQRVA